VTSFLRRSPRREVFEMRSLSIALAFVSIVGCGATAEVATSTPINDLEPDEIRFAIFGASGVALQARVSGAEH
jgi:hypothetical protein